MLLNASYTHINSTLSSKQLVSYLKPVHTPLQYLNRRCGRGCQSDTYLSHVIKVNLSHVTTQTAARAEDAAVHETQM